MVLFFSLHVHAAEEPWVMADQLRARLLPGDATEKGLAAGLEIELAEGWHAYWRVPGDAGLAPQFDWSASQNIEKVDVFWPYPRRFDEMGVTTFGYEGHVIFPLQIALAEKSKEAQLKLTLDIMVCKDICIPEKLAFSVHLPAVPQGQTFRSSYHSMVYAGNALYAERRRLPMDVDGADGFMPLNIKTIVTGTDALVITVESAHGFEGIMDVFASAGDKAFTAKPDIMMEGKNTAIIKIAKPPDMENVTEFLKGKALNIVVVSGVRAAEKTVQF